MTWQSHMLIAECLKNSILLKKAIQLNWFLYTEVNYGYGLIFHYVFIYVIPYQHESADLTDCSFFPK